MDGFETYNDGGRSDGVGHDAAAGGPWQGTVGAGRDPAAGTAGREILRLLGPVVRLTEVVLVIGLCVHFSSPMVSNVSGAGCDCSDPRTGRPALLALRHATVVSAHPAGGPAPRADAADAGGPVGPLASRAAND